MQPIAFTPLLRKLVFFLLLTASFTACNQEGERENKGSFTVPDTLDNATKLKFRQYAVQGRLLYEQHCANCHQADGTGLGRLIPPLAQADYLQKNRNQVLCIIRHGLKGSVVVNGQEYNQPMPANPQLTAIEIAEIATYIMNAWGNQGSFIEVGEAREILNNCQEAL